MLSIREYKKKIDKSGEAHLTLINSEGESFYAGTATEVVHLNNSKLKMRWKFQPAPVQWHPYTHAVLHEDNIILTMYEIAPVNIEASKSVELAFDYD